MVVAYNSGFNLTAHKQARTYPLIVASEITSFSYITRQQGQAG